MKGAVTANQGAHLQLDSLEIKTLQGHVKNMSLVLFYTKIT